MAGPTNADIMQTLGKLEGLFSGIRHELDNATTSRKVLYDKMEEQGRSIHTLNTTVEVGTQTISQVREEVKALRASQDTMAENVKPLLDLKDKLPGVVEGWLDLRKTTSRLLWVAGFILAGGFAGVVAFGSVVLQWFQHLLGVTPPSP